MKTKISLLLIAILCVSMTTSKNTKALDDDFANCCEFYGKFKFDSKGFSGEVGFKINFGITNPEDGDPSGSHGVDWGEIVFGPMGNSTIPINYIVITPPKEYIGKTVEISTSSVNFSNLSCGSELLQYVNVKIKPGKIKLQEKTKLQLVSAVGENGRDFEKPRRVKTAAKKLKSYRKQ